MEGRAAWRVRLSVAGKDRRVSVKVPWGGDLNVLELQQQKRAGDCDVSRGFGRRVIGLCKTDLVLYTRSEGKLEGGAAIIPSETELACVVSILPELGLGTMRDCSRERKAQTEAARSGNERERVFDVSGISGILGAS
jgi:hypothetical protein